MRSPVRFRLKGTDTYVPALAQLDLDPGPVEQGAYEVAGNNGRRSRAWRVGSYGPNTSIAYVLDELRRKSRDQVRKNPYAAFAVDRLVSNIVGTGITPKSTAPDEGFRAAVTKLWLAWTDQADAVGAHDFYGLQTLAVRGMIEGGETFTRLRTRRLSDGLAVPLQLQVMEGDQCPHLKTEAVNNIRSGIQYNAIGQRTGYWMFREHPGDGILGGVMPAFDQTLVPAEEIAHLHRSMRTGQDDLDAYLDAELVRKKTAAMLVGFIKPAPSTNDHLGSGPPDDTGTAGLSLEPGTMQVLLDGEDVTFSDPKDVGPNFDAFVRQALRGVAAAAGLLYEELSGDYGQLNDRTLRAALNSFRRAAESWQHQIVVYQFCRKVWIRWIDLALLSGALKLPSGMTREQAYRVDWLPVRWPYVHPVQDVQAQQDEIQAGFASRSQKVGERGYDSTAIDAENASDNARADKLGLKYTAASRSRRRARLRAIPTQTSRRRPARADRRTSSGATPWPCWSMGTRSCSRARSATSTGTTASRRPTSSWRWPRSVAIRMSRSD